MADKKKVVKLCKKIAAMTSSSGAIRQLAEESPNMFGLCDILSDDMVDLGLCMDVRVPYTPEQLVKKAKMPEDKVKRLLDEMSDIGMVEFDYENEDHHKQYKLPIFILGSCENMVKNDKLIEKYPALADFFYELGERPLAPVAQMIPPGGAGIGLRVIPVEKAIPNKSESVNLEQISYWLKKYDEYALTACECRRAMRIRGEGCGELEDDLCILVGDYARYLVETGKARKVSYDEVIEVLERSEANGYMHQVSNVDGVDKIIGICNCSVGSCFALRMSQLYNAPNLSASTFRAHVTTENCVACGKCVEVCPAGAAKLGQKLCTKEGPVVYPKQPLPDDIVWGEKMWNKNYRNDNQKNCHESGTSPCKTACPAHIAVQGYIKMAAQGRYLDALKLIKMDNPFPAVCGSICNHRCETACTRGTVDQAVAIDEIKKFIAEQELNEKNRYIPERLMHKGNNEPYQEKIAIIGSGPAGMTCAYYLSNMGYDHVTVFEREKAPGGMLMHGIPSFRLEKDVVNAEIDVMRQMGVEIRCGVEVGKDITLEQLRKEGYQAFYIAIGCQGGRGVGVEGEDADGVQTGVDFLRKVNSNPESVKLEGETVVIGGGNVAIDVARTAVRCGNGNVSMFCLESRDIMPASADEIEEAEEEAVLINCGWGPKEILTENGKVTGIVFKKCLSVKDESGRFHPQYDESNVMTVACNHILLSVGQSIEWGNLLEGSKVKLGRGNGAVADPVTYQTDEPDIFVGGDVYSGPRFAIDAIAAGREGAISIHRYVHEGQSLTLARNPRDFYELDKTNIEIPKNSYDAPARQPVSKMPVEEAKKTFRNNHKTFTEEQVKAEASRCLGCGATIVDQNKCIGCGICTTRCNFDAIHLVREHPENIKMVRAEDTMKEILPYAAKRAKNIVIKKITGR